MCRRDPLFEARGTACLRDAEVGCWGDAAGHSPSPGWCLAKEQPAVPTGSLPSRFTGTLPAIPAASLSLSAPSRPQWAIGSLFLSCAKSSPVDKEQGLPS